MSEDGSSPQSTSGSDAELDLLSREKLMRDLTLKERTRLLAFKQIAPAQKTLVPLETEDDEEAADEEEIELDL